MAMDYTKATRTQLYTIIYHEPCSRTEKVLALMELKRRDRVPGVKLQARIMRKMG